MADVLCIAQTTFLVHYISYQRKEQLVGLYDQLHLPDCVSTFPFSNYWTDFTKFGTNVMTLNDAAKPNFLISHSP